MRKAFSLVIATITVMLKSFRTVNVFNKIMYYFGLDRSNFLHSSLYHAMFHICVENSVDNIRMFELLLSSVYTTSRPF